jgi:hypothetical protein
MFPFQSQAEDITVVTDIWEDYTNEDETGFYLDVLREVFPFPQYNLIIQYLPYKRAIYMVEQGEADITTGVNPGDMPDKYLAMEYVEKDTVDMLVKKELAENWQGLKSLKNKYVVAKIGYNFENFFEVPVHYKEKTQLLNMMKMLRAGRVDAVLDYKNDLEKLWDKAELTDDYVIVERVIVNDAYYAFADRSLALKKHFLEVYPALVKSEKIFKIGLQYGVENRNLPR